jgi:hypothetical protein
MLNKFHCVRQRTEQCERKCESTTCVACALMPVDPV